MWTGPQIVQLLRDLWMKLGSAVRLWIQPQGKLGHGGLAELPGWL